MSLLFTSGGHSIGASASASVLLMNIQGWFPLGLTPFISLLSKGISRVFFSTTVWKHQFFGAQPSQMVKASACNVGDPGSFPGLGTSLDKEMATHSSTLAWKIPWMEELGRLQSLGSQRLSDLTLYLLYSLLYGPAHVRTWQLEKP